MIKRTAGVLGAAGNNFMPAGLAAALLCGVLCTAGQSLNAQEKENEKDKSGINVTVQGKDTDAGLVISGQATPKEVGLPLYPGSRPHKEAKDDSSGAKLGLWGTTFGFKLAVMKLESNDSTEKVAVFYQKALAKYGKVLDCTNHPRASGDKENSHELTCQDDRPDPGGRMFKAGTKEKQHIVGITPNGSGSVFQLVYLESRSSERAPL